MNNTNCILEIREPEIVKGTLRAGGFFDTDLKIWDVIAFKDNTLYILRPSRKRDQHIIIDSNFETKGLMGRYIDPIQISIPNQTVLVGVLNLITVISGRALIKTSNGHKDNNNITYPIAYLVGRKKKRRKE